MALSKHGITNLTIFQVIRSLSQLIREIDIILIPYFTDTVSQRVSKNSQEKFPSR